MATGDTYVDNGLATRIALGKPAALDQAGYAALTPIVKLGGVISYPERGDSYTDAGEGTLEEGRKEYLAALKDGGALSIPIKHIEGDAGQAILLAQVGTNAAVSFQEVHPDGTATFYHGVVMEMKVREATQTSQKGYILMFGVNSDRFPGAPVAIT